MARLLSISVGAGSRADVKVLRTTAPALTQQRAPDLPQCAGSSHCPPFPAGLLHNDNRFVKSSWINYTIGSIWRNSISS